MSGSSRTTTRREFARRAALLAAGAPLALEACVHAPAAAPAPAPAPAGAATTPAPAAPAGDQERSTPEADALMELVRHRYGAQLSEEQLAAVKSSIAGMLRNAERLHAVPLPNAVEPAFVFSAFRAEV